MEGKNKNVRTHLLCECITFAQVRSSPTTHNGSKVALNTCLPLSQLNDLGKFLAGGGNSVDGIFGDISQILPNAPFPFLPIVGGGIRWELDLSRWKTIVVLLRHYPRKVRLQCK